MRKTQRGVQVFLGLLGGLLGCGLASGQQNGSTQKGGEQESSPLEVYRKMYPNPTGKNGYEEIVLAGASLMGNRLLDEAQQPGTTLTMKRRALGQLPVKKALALLREGLAKPIQTPAPPSPKAQETNTFQHFAYIRQLARVLAIEQYVLLADGKVGEAIDSLRDGLNIGYHVQGEMVLGSLVGIAVDAIVLDRLARHLDQLSVRDCEKLLSLTQEWLALPDPSIAALTTEKKQFLDFMNQQTLDPTEALKNVGADDEGDQKLDEVGQFLKENPGAAKPLAEKIIAALTAQYDHNIAQLRLPYWKRTPPKQDRSDPILTRMMDALSFTEMNQTVTGKWAMLQAQIHLLGVHAAIRRYKWEYDRLPTSLSALRLGDFILDPFTGDPLAYRAKDGAYELYSAGPLKPKEEGDRAVSDGSSPASGEREPIYLPRRRKN